MMSLCTSSVAQRSSMRIRQNVEKILSLGCVLRMMVSEKCIGCPLANSCLVNTEETKECDI